VVINNVDSSEATIRAKALGGFSNIKRFEVKILQGQTSFGEACNAGARMFSSPLVMFLNDDIELDDDAIDKVVRSFDNLEIGIVGIKLIFPKDSIVPGRPAGKIQHIGMSLDINANPQHPLVGWSADNPKCCVSREVWAVTGACLTVRRGLFNKIGGFDKRYEVGYFEDVDLCLSVRQLGGKIYINADAIGQHHTGATMTKRKTPAPMQENAMKFKTKWASTGLLIWDMHTYY
jgi:GT2 family glycosyltransferase